MSLNICGFSRRGSNRWDKYSHQRISQGAVSENEMAPFLFLTTDAHSDLPFRLRQAGVKSARGTGIGIQADGFKAVSC